MTRPGHLLRALCLRWCSDRTRQRLIDPALADLQVEYADAQRSGSRARAAWTLAVGYTAVARTLLLAGAGEFSMALRTWRLEELEGFRRGARTTLVLLTLGTALLIAPLLSEFVWHFQDFDWRARSLLAAYLIPSALPLSAPCSLALAVAWVLYGVARTRKVAGAVLVVASLVSAAMLANVVWVVPEANQAFRHRVYTALTSDATAQLPRGRNELTWTEAQQRRLEVHARADAREIRSFDTWYYRRFAMGLAPLSLVALIVAVAFRRRWTRAGLTSVTLAVCAVNYTLLMSALWVADLWILPPVVLAWSGDAVCAAGAVLLACAPRAPGASVLPPAPSTR